MLIVHVQMLAFAQHVITSSGLLGVRIATREPFLTEVPENFYHVSSGCGIGQEAHVWADDLGAEVFIVMPGFGIFGADWTDEQLSAPRPDLGVVASV